MSQKKPYTIACPKCAEPQEVELFDSLNIAEDPDLRDALMHNRINQVQCPSCDFLFRVDKPLLYADPGQNFIVFLNPTPGVPDVRNQQVFMEWMEKVNLTLPDGIDAPDIHLVANRTELVERVFLLEEDLDARVIEYVKHIIYSKNLGKVNPDQKVLLFDAQDSTEEKLCFVVQDAESRQLESVIEYSREAYKGLCEVFDQDEQTAALMELFPGPYISARAIFLADKPA